MIVGTEESSDRRATYKGDEEVAHRPGSSGRTDSRRWRATLRDEDKDARDGDWEPAQRHSKAADVEPALSTNAFSALSWLTREEERRFSESESLRKRAWSLAIREEGNVEERLDDVSGVSGTSLEARRPPLSLGEAGSATDMALLDDDEDTGVDGGGGADMCRRKNCAFLNMLFLAFRGESEQKERTETSNVRRFGFGGRMCAGRWGCTAAVTGLLVLVRSPAVGRNENPSKGRGWENHFEP